MEKREIKFAQCELVINETQIPQLNIFTNKKDDIYIVDGISYMVDCEIINEKLFWIYVRYGKAKPYSDEVLNIQTKEIAQNKRETNEVELRNQLFCIYAPNEAVLHMSNFRKSTFLASYLKSRFDQEFIIKKYFIKPEEFVKEITSVQSLKFAGMNKSLFNSSIFDEVEDTLGYASKSLIKFNVEAKIKEHAYDSGKLLDFLSFWKTKKEKREIDKIVCIGKDDNGFEKIFNLDTFLKKIKVSASADENEMYDPRIVKDALLRRLNV